jgi:acyl carrier protein
LTEAELCATVRARDVPRAFILRRMTTPVSLEGLQALVGRVAGFTPPDAGPDTPLIDGGFWLDSVRLLEAIIECEVEFGVTFDPESDFSEARLTTVGALFALLQAKRPG